MVGVPGKVVARNGRKIPTEGTNGMDIDLRHDLLPDPVAEMLQCLQVKIERLDKRTRELEKQNMRLLNLSS